MLSDNVTVRNLSVTLSPWAQLAQNQLLGIPRTGHLYQPKIIEAIRCRNIKYIRSVVQVKVDVHAMRTANYVTLEALAKSAPSPHLAPSQPDSEPSNLHHHPPPTNTTNKSLSTPPT
jgi:hypothetical protein